MRLPYIVGNWKMNTTRAEAVALAKATADVAERVRGVVDVGVCPPYPWIPPVADAIAGTALQVGAQDCAAEQKGAFTGDVSAAMLVECCGFTLVGHSERRTHHHESDLVVRDKLRQALDDGLRVILCVGESLTEREAGQAEQVVARQLDAALEQVEAGEATRVGIAYEPVWAIGTGVAATERDAATMASFIRSDLDRRFSEAGGACRVLYGGSANDRNAGSYLASPDVDGLLVGGASLSATSFAAMIEAAAGVSSASSARGTED